jgi:hypothetical protein
MPIEIINLPFQGSDDKCLVLGNAQWAATGIGTSWNELWIGIRYCLEDGGSSTGAHIGFFVGVLSNPVNDSNGRLNNGYLLPQTSHWIGLAPLVVGASRAYDAGTGRVQYTTSFCLAHRNGASVNVSSGINLGIMGSVPFGTKRYVMIVRLQKGSGTPYTMSMQVMAPTQNTIASHWPSGNVITTAHLVNMMLSANLSSAADLARQYENNGNSYQATSTVGVGGVNETTLGPLNAIHVTWGLVTPRLAISDICYVIKS